MRPLGGHLGVHVSALVDDQLPPRDAERGWRHVQGCRSCREAVQQELWVKDRLHAASAPPVPPMPDPALTAALAALAPVDRGSPLPRRGVRRGGVAALGVGTVTAALTGVVLLGWEPSTPEPQQNVVDRQPSPYSPGPFPGGGAARLQTP